MTILKIPLTKGAHAIIDSEDFHFVSKRKWHFNMGYARASIAENGHKKHVCMQTVIMNPPPGMIVDHINRDRLDNRRINLRVCTRQQNNWNMGMQRNNTTGIRGVYFSKEKKKFIAQIKVNGRQISLGGFLTASEAAAVYMAAAIERRGEFASFP